MSIPTATIITASSQTGAACIEQLLTRYNGAVRVKAAFRSEERAAELRAHHGENANLEIVVGVDAANPTTLPPAFEGASIAYIVTPHEAGRGFGQDADMNTNMVRAALDAGVKHIVFGGSWTVHAPEDVPDIAARFVGTEALLKALAEEGRVTWTMIRGGWYAANTVHLFGKSIRESSTIRLPSTICVPPIDTDDIGASAAAVIAAGGVGHELKAYEMSGPAPAIDGPEFARIFSETLGRPISYVDVPIDAFTAHMPKFAGDVMRRFDAKGPEGVPLTDDVFKLTGHHTSFAEWAVKNKEKFL